MRQSTLLNKAWWFKVGFDVPDVDSMQEENYNSVTLPHTVRELPLNYFHETDYQGLFCYQRLLTSKDLRERKAGQRVMLDFEAVMTYAEVYINGQLMISHKGGFTPFSVDITSALVDQGINRITVVVDSTERPDIPPFGGQIDYLTYGGIYRDVHLRLVDPVSIKNIKIETQQTLARVKGVRVQAMLQDSLHLDEVVAVKFELLDNENTMLAETLVNGYSNQILDAEFSNLIDLQLWTPEQPVMYQIRCTLASSTSNDIYSDRFGFRTAEFTTEGFFLNGKKFKLVGVNRHQSWPYLGYAVGNRAQRHDADLLKFEYGMNTVRTSHYPQSKAFIQRCDEIGLLVFEEIPGWQHIGDAEWQEQAIVDVQDMIERDWNSPSIILWGVRINESPDSSAFYRRTNELARRLDPTRQTGGVRCIESSEFLEDVYTMNDFIHSGDNILLRDPMTVTSLAHQVPYLVTEYIGHMYPTKRFDQEERQHEHVMRHLKILDHMFADPVISGAIGWCFFDYNTHKDFGSGDRICYHGITDMFRLPKHAAYAYQSMLSPAVKPVLHPVTVWARGERSISGAMPLLVVTNCDYIEFQYGDQQVRRVYPDRDTFPNLPHAPVLLDQRSIDPAELGEWGLAWASLSLRGFVNGKQVVETQFAADPVPTQVLLTADDYELSAEHKELTRITIAGVDQVGNIMPYWNPVVNLSVTGPGRIVGPKQIALNGGMIGSYIETSLSVGDIVVTAAIEGFAQQQIIIEVR